jgi:hypothetical protein
MNLHACMLKEEDIVVQVSLPDLYSMLVTALEANTNWKW